MSDDQFSFSDKKSRSAKSGRRARKEAQQPPELTQTPDDGTEEEMLGSMETKQSIGADLDDGPPKPSRRTSGWGEPLSASRRTMDDIDDDRLRPQTAGFDRSDSDSDIPTIPDLEDLQDNDLTAQIAIAPNVAVNRVATFRELDNDLLQHAAFLTLDDIDLKLLSKALSPEADIREEDVCWEWDRLFTEVTSELTTEWEVETGGEDAAPTPA